MKTGDLAGHAIDPPHPTICIQVCCGYFTGSD